MNGNMELTRFLSPLPVEPCPVFVTLVSTIHNSVDVYKGGVLPELVKCMKTLCYMSMQFPIIPRLFENEVHSSFTLLSPVVSGRQCRVYLTTCALSMQ